MDILSTSILIFITQLIFIGSRTWNVISIGKLNTFSALASGTVVHLSWLVSISIGGYSTYEIMANFRFEYLPIVVCSLTGGLFGTYLFLEREKKKVASKTMERAKENSEKRKAQAKLVPSSKVEAHPKDDNDDCGGARVMTDLEKEGMRISEIINESIIGPALHAVFQRSLIDIRKERSYERGNFKEGQQVTRLEFSTSQKDSRETYERHFKEKAREFIEEIKVRTQGREIEAFFPNISVVREDYFEFPITFNGYSFMIYVSHDPDNMHLKTSFQFSYLEKELTPQEVITKAPVLMSDLENILLDDLDEIIEDLHERPPMKKGQKQTRVKRVGTYAFEDGRTADIVLVVSTDKDKINRI